jgi:hypothetical protein
MSMGNLIELAFSSTHTAHAARVEDLADLPGALLDLGLRPPYLTLVLAGGASGVVDGDFARLRPLFAESLAPLAESLGAAVVDGGTDAGVMQMMGQARASGPYHFPLIGLLGERLTNGLGHLGRSNRAPLEPHHTHFILAQHISDLDEPIWLSRTASALSGSMPSVTLLVNGGAIAYREVSQSIADGRPVLVVAGSGRAADRLAQAMRGKAADRQDQELAASGLLHLIDLSEGRDHLSQAIQKVSLP